MRRHALALAGLLAVGCTMGWQPLPEELRPPAELTVTGGFQRVVTARGLTVMAATAWQPLGVRYADGLVAGFAQAAYPDETAAWLLYGPGRTETTPTGLRFEPAGDALDAIVALGDVHGTVPLELGTAGGQPIVCTAHLTLVGAAYRFPLVPQTGEDGTLGVVAAAAGTVERTAVVADLPDCAFSLTPAREAMAASLLADALSEVLDAEWSTTLGPAAAHALDPRFARTGLLPLPPGASVADGAALALAVTPTALLAPAAGGVVSRHDVGLAARPTGCATGQARPGPTSAPATPPELAPDGATYDEAIVVSRALVALALDAANVSGLFAGPLPVATPVDGAADGLLALWPSDAPLEVLRLRGAASSVRLAFEPLDDAPALTLAAATPAHEGSEAVAPLRLAAGRLRLEIYGRVADVEVRLLTLETDGAVLSLAPYVGDDGWLRLGLTAFEAGRIVARAGLLSLPAPDARWVTGFLARVLPGLPILDLGALPPPVPSIVAGEWRGGGEAYVVYLRRSF